jgi:hypothetical protein
MAASSLVLPGQILKQGGSGAEKKLLGTGSLSGVEPTGPPGPKLFPGCGRIEAHVLIPFSH